jgi:hypothetical protein
MFAHFLAKPVVSCTSIKGTYAVAMCGSRSLSRSNLYPSAWIQTMINRPLSVLLFALSIFFLDTTAGVPQQAAPRRAMLPIVNDAAFTSGPVIVDNSHCGLNYVLGGGAFYTASVPGAPGFPQGCTVTITNSDISACKGKSVQVAGFPALFVLWPGQVVQLTNVTNAWIETINPGRWRPNCATFPLVINTDSQNGSDHAGLADGLGTGTEAFKSVQYALQFVLTDFDFAGAPQTQVKILMAPGSTDATGIHYAPHGSNPGSQGGAVLTIDGNGGIVVGQSDFLFDAIVQIRNLTFSNPSGTCLNVQQRAYVLLADQITFGACAGSQINVGLYGQVEFFNDFTISGGGGFFITNAGGLLYTGTGITASVSSNITYTNGVVVGQFPGWTQLGQITWSLGSNTVRGKKYEIGSNHVLTGSANIPGSVAGTTATGGQAL